MKKNKFIPLTVEAEDDRMVHALAEMKRLEKQLFSCKNLLAVIHRDGGHHTEEVGVVQSAKDAEQKVLAWITELEVSTRHSLPLLHGSATDERL